MESRNFKKQIWKYYRKHKRELPWRNTRDPYKILVSEIMLQQTQAHRVIPKYNAFIKKFPNFERLAKAPTRSVLALWQDLGYNRRALYLVRCAQEVIQSYKGKLPKDFKALCALPGIGPATAGDIMMFAWNMPVPVIETNIRTVYIHFFFKDKKKVHDREILPLVEQTMDTKNPRDWYFALLDYGVYLKKEHTNPTRKSAHYVKQSKFDGSYRQKRAHILRQLLNTPNTVHGLQKTTKYEYNTTIKILADLEREGFITKKRATYSVI